MSGHQKCWLWGRHVVLETLRAGRWTPRELWISTEIDPQTRSEAQAAAKEIGLSTADHDADEMTRCCGTLEHQGLIAKMPPFPYADAADLMQRAPDCPFFLLLDEIQDPYNFGAMLRTADVFALDGVFVAERNQCDVTAQVVRSSAGAVNHVSLARVDDLPALARDLRSHETQVIAASETADRTSVQQDLTGPTMLVIGNEGRGIRPELLAECTASVRIPQWGRVASLNAAVAAGILMYEVRRQRGAQPEGKKTRSTKTGPVDHSGL